MTFKKLFWLYLLCILSLVGTWYIMPQLPEQIANHWNIHGVVDGWAGKQSQYFLASIALALLVFFQFMPRIDPKRENYQYHTKSYFMTIATLVVFLNVMNGVTIAYNLGVPIPVDRVVCFFLGILFMISGNYLAQVRHNYFFGIRTPWTLASETVWRKTHRFGSKLMFASGVLVILSTFISSFVSFVVLMSTSLGTALVSAVYSYLLYARETRR